ncbi:hypothetical protein BUY99_14980, partial [Staphylococcus gallinarum]
IIVPGVIIKPDSIGLNLKTDCVNIGKILSTDKSSIIVKKIAEILSIVTLFLKNFKLING